MALVLNDEQTMLRESARGFLKEKAPVSQLRQLRDTNNPDGYCKDTWAAMAEMGWAGIVIDEVFGGLEFGHAGGGVLMQEMGRTLTASPFLSSSIMGAALISSEGTDEQKNSLLPGIASGTLITALALDETGRHDPNRIKTKATTSGNGFEITGAKTFVLDGHVADKLIVAARTAGDSSDMDGITLFMVDPRSEGVTCERTVMVDSRNAARISFEGVQVSGEDVLGDAGKGFPALDKVLDIGRIYLGAEMAGVSQACFSSTVGYLKEREQFGQKIGSFQALQHRAAHLYSEIELLKSAVMKGLQALDADSDDTKRLASMVKAKAGQVAILATNEAVQMHGGMGMTDDFDIGFFMKRARVAQETFGDAAFHTDRLADLSGY